MTAELLLVLGVGGIFLSIGLALTVIGVATAEKRAVGRSLAALEAITAAPKEMQDELERPFSERVIEPLVERFAKFGRRFSPSDNAERIQHRLDVAGNPVGWSVDRVLGLKMIGFIVMLAISLGLTMLVGLSLFTTLVVCVGLSMAGYMAPNYYIYQKGYDRSEKMQRELPDALDLLTISVEAGLAFDSALSRVAKSTEGPLAQEFARVLQEMNIGMGRTEAMKALGERTQIPELRAFVTAMVQADAFGIPIGQVLRVQSVEMRTKRRQRAEEKAQKVPVKILFPLIFFILPTLFLVVMGPGVITMIQSFGGTGFK
ncbi:MAG: type II secretion system F family protein [Nocardioidaceae bacterium]